jgi:hypothetical protein
MKPVPGYCSGMVLRLPSSSGLIKSHVIGGDAKNGRSLGVLGDVWIGVCVCVLSSGFSGEPATECLAARGSAAVLTEESRFNCAKKLWYSSFACRAAARGAVGEGVHAIRGIATRE